MKPQFLAPFALSLAVMFSLASVSAQAAVPNGVFVRESNGTAWLVLDGQRVNVPFWQATDADIAALPQSDRWAVMNELGAIAAGERPTWYLEQGTTPPPSSAAVPVPAVPSAAAAVAPPPLSPAPVTAAASKRVGETTVLTTPDGVRIAITVNGVADPARSTNQFNAPKGRWVVVDWTVKNEGATDFRHSALYFKLQTADSFVVDRGNHAGHKEPNLDSAVLGAGQTVRGFLAYDVPSGQKLTAALFQSGQSRQFVVAELP